MTQYDAFVRLLGRKEMDSTPLFEWAALGYSRAELDGNDLVWDSSNGPDLWVIPSNLGVAKLMQMIADFLSLAEIKDFRFFRAAALKYSRKWGNLGLCACGLPLTHRVRPQPPGNAMAIQGLGTSCGRAQKGKFIREPLERWRFYASQMRDAIRLASASRHPPTNLAALRETCKQLHASLGSPPDQFGALLHNGEVSIYTLTTLVHRTANNWLGLASVRPLVTTRGTYNQIAEAGKAEFTLSLWPSASNINLFVLLAVLLSLLIIGTLDIAPCAGDCGRWFRLMRQQRHLPRAYCPACGTRVSNLKAQHRRRQRLREDPESRIRTRLNPSQRAAIKRARKRPGLANQLASKYNVTVQHICRLRKQTGKTPPKELDIARKRMKELKHG